MLEEMNNRSDDIHNHLAMKAALYLDPRFRMVVGRNSFNVDEAKDFIIRMNQRLNRCKNQVEANESIEADADSDDSIGIRFNEEAAMNEYLGANQTN